MIRRNTVRSRSKIIRMKKVPGPQLYSPREKLQDCIWIFTIGDADDKPSVPHAHAQGTGYRLDAWTGDIYPAGSERKRTIGKLSKKRAGEITFRPRIFKICKETNSMVQGKQSQDKFLCAGMVYDFNQEK